MTNSIRRFLEGTSLEELNAHGLGELPSRMGIQVTSYDREHIAATMPAEGNTQTMGLVHGGAYVVLGETLGSVHANYLAPEGAYAVGIDINATHTGSATSGHVTAVCRPIHVGRTLTVHEIVVKTETGKLCSTVRITNLYKQRDTSSPDHRPSEQN